MRIQDKSGSISAEEIQAVAEQLGKSFSKVGYRRVLTHTGETCCGSTYW